MRRHSIVLRLALTIILTSAAVSAVFAQDFALQVGPPVAGNSQQTKKATLVVRPGGCADPAQARITGTAEGLVNGVRQSKPLTLEALSTPGVHAVSGGWAKDGVWIVNLVGTCGSKTAGAIITLGPKDTYRREGVKLLTHRPTPEEIDASLKALTTGGSK